jgi:hypothetical protein
MIRALPFALLLAGCGTTKIVQGAPIVTTVEVPVPVVAPCVPKSLASAPDYPDTNDALRAAPDAADRYRLLGAGRLLRSARLNELEGVVAGCPREN